MAKLVQSGVMTDREKLWAAMRDLRVFTTRDLALKSHVVRCKGKIREYVDALTRAGILVKTPALSPGCFAKFELVRDLGVEAPRVRKDGTAVLDDGQTRMWRAMKILKPFPVRDLPVHASLPGAPVADSTATVYCRWLGAGGYLVALGGEVPRWRFVRDTGAKAPQILRVKKLFDPNLGEVVAREDVLDVLERDHGQG